MSPPSSPDAFDVVESPGTTVTSVTKSFTVGTGTNRGLYVFVRTNNIAVSSVTWNGTALSAISGSYIDDSIYCLDRIEWFHLENPSTGTHNLVVTFASTAYYMVSIHSYFGVAQTGKVDASTAALQSSTVNNYSPTITTGTDGSWVLAGTYTNDSIYPISSSNMTQRNVAPSAYAYTWDSNGAESPAGTYTANFSESGDARRWLVSMIAIKP